MKKFVLLVCAVVGVVSLVGCGQRYTCSQCEETTSKAYYDMKSSKDYVMCEDCARQYWMPLDYRTYRVK